MTTATELHVEKVSLSFGGLRAVHEFSLHLRPQALCGLIGPNGAGKTTVFNLLTGVYAPDSGSITLGQQNLVGKRPHQRAHAGLARTFQNIRLFGELSVLDNVLIACETRSRSGVVSNLLRLPHALVEDRSLEAQARKLLDLFGLGALTHATAKSLPYGQQRRLEIARALATRPSVLLLDEPAAGMTPPEKNELRQLIERVRKEFACSVLLIEHDMGLVMQVCEHIAVLDHGVQIAAGTPTEIQSNPAVIEAYLGQAEGSDGPA